MKYIVFDRYCIFFILEESKEFRKSVKVQIKNFFSDEYNPLKYEFVPISNDLKEFYFETLEVHEISSFDTEYIFNIFPEKFL